MKIALVVGHSKKAKGARNRASKMTEFDYNDELVKKIAVMLNKRGIDNVIVYRDSYSALPGKINAKKPTFILSFHANSCKNDAVSGSEVLYYKDSKKGKLLAQVMLNAIVKTLELRNRGIKPRSESDRGGYLLKNTHAACVILEPFFINNNADCETATNKLDELAVSIALAIENI